MLAHQRSSDRDHARSWGEDVIVSSLSLRDLRPASALTYVEVATLARADLDAVLESFPQSAAIIRQSAMKVAMQRAVVIISEYVRSRRDLKASGDPRLAKEQAAHSSLMTAFGGDPSSDPAMILRLITGANLKDIVDGQLVEEVEDAAAESDTGAVLAALRRESQERVAMRKELSEVKGDVATIKDMLTALLARG